MNGLLKNNYYASLAGAKWLAFTLFFSGIIVTAAGRREWLIVYSLLCITGFSANASGSLRKEGASKWSLYKLSLPVPRKMIVKSQYVSQLLWILFGALAAGICISLSVLLHGFLFDLPTDVFSVFTVGISISLYMDSIFYPLYYVGGEERTEVITVLSLAGAVILFSGIVYLINFAFDFSMEPWQVLLSMAAVLLIASLAFTASYFITVTIFEKT